MTHILRCIGSSTQQLVMIPEEESQRLEMLADRVAFWCISQFATSWMEALQQLPDWELPNHITFSIPDTRPDSPYNLACKELQLDPVAVLRPKVTFDNGPDIQNLADIRYRRLAELVASKLEDFCSSIKMISGGRLTLNHTVKTRPLAKEVPFHSRWVVSATSSLDPSSKPLHHCAKYDYPVTLTGSGQSSIPMDTMQRILGQYSSQCGA